MDIRKKTLLQQIRNNPEDTFSKFALALEYWKDDRRDKAQLLLEHIYSADPDYLGLYYHLAKLYYEQSKYELARRMYQEGIELARKQKDNHTLQELQGALQELEMDLEE